LIKQGVTTIIGGNCGSSRFPLTTAMLEDEDKYLSSEYGLKVDWHDLAGFSGGWQKKGWQSILPPWSGRELFGLLS